MSEVIVGTGDFRFQIEPNWATVGGSHELAVISDVATDSKSRVYVYSRALHPVTVFDADGSIVATWGRGVIQDAHGIFIDASDTVYLTDRDMHEVLICDTAGQVKDRLGKRGTAALEQPFNHPTAVAVDHHGDMYVADGYGNSRVHRFTSDGVHVLSWGRPGDGPGEFCVPHSVAVSDEDVVFVCDRGNSRIQLFSTDGTYLSEWRGFFKPTSVTIRGDLVYVTDLCSRLSIFSTSGALLSRARILMDGGHGAAVDSNGDVYVVEIHARRVDKFRRLA